MRIIMPNPDERESDEAKIVRAVLRLARALRQAASGSEVSGGALGLLATLYRRGSMSAIELAGHERLQPQSLSRHLARLDNDGFIERTVDAADHRRKLIALTPQGAAALGRAMTVRRRRLAEMMTDRLNARERATLLHAATLMLRLAE